MAGIIAVILREEKKTSDTAHIRVLKRQWFSDLAAATEWLSKELKSHRREGRYGGRKERFEQLFVEAPSNDISTSDIEQWLQETWRPSKADERGGIIGKVKKWPIESQPDK